MGSHPLSESESSLIESGAVTLADVIEGREMLAAAVAAEEGESREVTAWDRTHCPVCGANVLASPEHCRL